MDQHLVPDQTCWTLPNTAAYRRISIALFLAGFASFSLLYCVQPLLPAFTGDFHVGAAESSLALSLTTGSLAIAILCAGAGSEMLGRRGLMFASMCGAAILDLAAAAAPTWHALLIVRALEGFVLGGVPAVAMAYLSEEIHPRGLGLSMGLYVGGTAFGGMFGRVGIGALTTYASWRAALGIMGAVDLVAAIGFIALLPASRNFRRRPGLAPAYHLSAWYGHLRRSGLPLLFLIGCLVMGAFVTVYNYAGFRLAASPYDLNPTQISLIFVVYLLAMAACPVAGMLADSLGRGPVLAGGIVIAAIGAGATLSQSLDGIIAGVAILTIGFFVAHSVASGWVGHLAPSTKGHAASLYLLAYYLGSSIMGSAGGWFWTAGRWPAVVAFTGALLMLALIAALRVRPLQTPELNAVPARTRDRVRLREPVLGFASAVGCVGRTGPSRSGNRRRSA
jgi:YNFM family putative membrane transporter